MKNLLVLRLSSMGDVLLTLPVMTGILDKNPGVQLIFVTRKKFIPYFAGIDRLTAVPFDPGGRHRGFTGLIRLFSELRRYPFDAVIDLHGILRTWVLDALFMLSGRRAYTVSKHRRQRRLAITNRQPGKVLPHATERYLKVFERAGMQTAMNPDVFSTLPANRAGAGINREIVRIGIAPLSRHQTKNWGLDQVSRLIRLTRKEFMTEFHLFGGPEDAQLLDSVSGTGIFNHAGKMDPLDELKLIRTMDVFLSMDSANMHLAAMAGVPTVSLWGATDPSLGFAPLFQAPENALYTDSPQVSCRPCSIYGEVPCKNHATPMICMSSIQPVRVLAKIKEILGLAVQN
jgi:ADP-heptose:LPS heptosyltransferase